VADSAAHGLAAAVLMGVSSGIRRRCRAMAAARGSRGGKVLPPCVPDAQLAAALPAISILVQAQVCLKCTCAGMQTLANVSLTPQFLSPCAEPFTWPQILLSFSLQVVIPAECMLQQVFVSTCSQAHCDWGDEPPDGAWQSAHALVTLAGHLADVLADADRTAAGSSAAAAGSSTTAGSSAAPAAAAAAAGVAADARPAGPAGGMQAGGGGSAPTEAEDHAAWRAYTAAASQPSLEELAGTAVTGAVAVAGWAANVLKQVQRDGAGVSVYSNRLEKA
jgi:hypothetical protein